MICGASIEIPVGIHAVGVGRVGGALVSITAAAAAAPTTAASTIATACRIAYVVVEALVVPLPAAPRTMALLLADLAPLTVTAVAAVTIVLARCTAATAVV